VSESMANRTTHGVMAVTVESLHECSDIDWDEVSIAQQILILRRWQLKSQDTVLGTVACELQKILVSRSQKKGSASISIATEVGGA